MDEISFASLEAMLGEKGTLSLARFLLENLEGEGEVYDQRMEELSDYVSSAETDSIFDMLSGGRGGSSFGFMSYTPTRIPFDLKAALDAAKKVRDGLRAYINARITDLENKYPDVKFIDAELARRAGFHRAYFHNNMDEVVDGRQPSKRFLLGLCIALELNVTQAKELLTAGGYELLTTDDTDVIVAHFLSREFQKPHIEEVDKVLKYCGLKPIGAE